MADVHGRGAVPALVGIAACLVVTSMVFAPTLATLAAPTGAASAASAVALLPIAAVLAAIAAIGRGGPPEQPKLEPAMLGAIPLLLGAMLLSLLGTARLGFDYWVFRLDVVAVVLFALGCMMLAMGVRAVSRHGAIAVVVLTLPPIALPIVQRLDAAVTDAVRATADRLVTAFGLGVTSLGDGIYRADEGGGSISVAAACGGIDALALTAAVMAAALVAFEGRWWAKLVLLATSLALVWMLNVARIASLLWLHGHDHERAFDALHASGGMLLVAIATAGSLLVAPRMGLHLRWRGFARARVTYGVRYVGMAGATVLVAGAACSAGIAASGVAGDDRSVDRTVALALVAGAEDADALEVDEEAAQPPRLAMEVPGHEVRADASFPWMRTLFGDESESGSYTVLAEGEQPVWAQVIVSTSRRSVDRYAPLDCFVAHGARIVRVRRVELPGGAAMLVDQRLHGTAFTALSWIQPAVLPDGRSGWRRMVLLAEARRGRDQRVPAAAGAVDRFAFGLLNSLSPAAERSPRGHAYGPPGRRLVDVASEMLAAKV